MRKFTAMKIVPKHNENGAQTGEWVATEMITCEVTGEMDTGEKVWTDIETGEQYFLTRMCRHNMFFHI